MDEVIPTDEMPDVEPARVPTDDEMNLSQRYLVNRFRVLSDRFEACLENTTRLHGEIERENARLAGYIGELRSKVASASHFAHLQAQRLEKAGRMFTDIKMRLEAIESVDIASLSARIESLEETLRVEATPTDVDELLSEAIASDASDENVDTDSEPD